MKKIMIICLMTLIAVMVQAQVKIVPQLAEGMKQVYELKGQAEMAGENINLNSTNTYVVTGETPDGYTIDITSAMKVDEDNNLMGIMLNMVQVMLKDIVIKVETDKEGVVKRILNFDEVKTKASANFKDLIDELYEQFPEMAKGISKDQLFKQGVDAIKEDQLLNGILLTPTSPLSLNGKTIQTLVQEPYINSQNIKMKRVYFLTNNNKTITATSKVDMTKDELKDFIIKQVEESAPDQLEMVKQNIDMIINSGMMTIDGTEKVTYQMGDNGWYQSADYSLDLDVMGQKIKTTMEAVLQ